jgi:hypothetical protein
VPSIIPKTNSSIMKKTLPGPIVVSTGVQQKGSVANIGTAVSKLWISEGHPINRKTGKRMSGGPFHVTHSEPYLRFGNVSKAFGGNNLELLYSGPVYGVQQHDAAVKASYDSTTPSEMDTSSMNADGATAISLVAPTNPTANLGTTLAETFREGVPSLPGIQSWKSRAGILRNVGSEYLNYQFGWAPLKSEIDSVVNAARHHRDIMQNYEHNEGRNVHRRFDFSPEITTVEAELSSGHALLPLNSTYLGATPPGTSVAKVIVRSKHERRRWFEGCFTYGGPGVADNYKRHLGFGREADAVFGLNLTPDVLWELTPWSWAVDWFTNAGDVINNVSQFANAGLVMRYGYMMEETVNTYYTLYGKSPWRVMDSYSPKRSHVDWMGGCSIGQRTVRKSRCPANPFGFGVGWEGLSPTQLAITAALGITRLL